MYEKLMEEVNTLNDSFGWYGSVDAMNFIAKHREEYEDTQILIEYDEFVAEAANIFKSMREEKVV